MRTFSILFCFICFSFSEIYAQSYKEKIDSIYSFKIADLSARDMENKYKQLDEFWQELNTDTSKSLPLIRKELQKPGYSSYFYFDMSSYLEMQSNKSPDKRVIERALKNIQWTELGTWELVEKLRNFSLNGIDVTDIAFQLLSQKKVKLNNPETGELFNQGKILAYLLLPLKKELYLNKMDTFFMNSTPESQRSIITLFWMTNTSFGKTKLEDIAANKVSGILTTDVRSYADRLLRRFPPNENELQQYKDLQPDEQRQELISAYNKALSSWDNQSWDKLILYSKLMHYLEWAIDN